MNLIIYKCNIIQQMINIIFILFFSISLGIEKPKIALVLSGGGAKGISEIPAMHIIDSLNIPIYNWHKYGSYRRSILFNWIFSP